MADIFQFPVTQTDIQPRFFDTDMLGHISTTAYIQYIELGRMDLLQAAREQNQTVPISVVANIDIDFIQEILLGDTVTVTTWCSRIGSKSMIANSAVYANKKLAAKAAATLVGFDTTTRQSTRLPQHWRASDFTLE